MKTLKSLNRLDKFFQDLAKSRKFMHWDIEEGGRIRGTLRSGQIVQVVQLAADIKSQSIKKIAANFCPLTGTALLHGQLEEGLDPGNVDLDLSQYEYDTITYASDQNLQWLRSCFFMNFKNKKKLKQFIDCEKLRTRILQTLGLEKHPNA